MLKAEYFFHLDGYAHRDLFAGTEFVWDSLKKLKNYLAAIVGTIPSCPGFVSGVPLPVPFVIYNREFFSALPDTVQIQYGDATKGKLKVYRNGVLLQGASVLMAGAVMVGNRFSIGRGVLIESGAMLKEPLIIGDNTEIRQGAYMRGYCLTGRRCVVGHTTEVKHSVFFDDARAGHFAYLGDSILGFNVNLGAGTKFANLRFLPGNVLVKTKTGGESVIIDSGLRKFGAILGDCTQTGCNSVTNPGTLLGPGSILMANATSPSGFHKASSVIK